MTHPPLRPGAPVEVAPPLGLGPIEELALPYDAAELSAKVAKRRRRMWSRLVSTLITAGLLVGLYLWRGEQFGGTSYLVFSGVIVAVSLVVFLVVLLSYRQAKRELDAMPAGTAVRIGRAGVEVASLAVRWGEVESLAAVPGKVGRSARLRLRALGGAEASVPLEQVVVRPATLDSTARAYSAGRHGVDLSRLEN